MGAELIVPSTGGSAPSGTGIVRATGGAFVDPAAPLGATDIPTGVDAAKLADGSVSNTELQYINSLTSNAQTQLTAKLDKAGGTMTGDLVIPIGNLKPSGSGGANMVVKQASSGGALSVSALVPGDIPPALYVDATLSSQSTTSGSNYTLLYTNTTLQGWTYSAGTYTCTVEGVYVFDCIYAIGGNASASNIMLWKNGTQIRNGPNSTPAAILPGFFSAYFGIGDTAQIRAYTTTGGAVSTTSYYSYLQISRIG